MPLSRVFGQRRTACGAAAVWDSHDAMIQAIQSIQFQKKNASREPRLGPAGGVRFSY